VARIDIRRTATVGIPTQPTEVAGPLAAPVSPVIGAIGEAAGRTAQFVKQYQQAEFNFMAVETDLAISEEMTLYNKALRTNPILSDPYGTDDIITKKEKHWLAFSEKIQKNIINNIGNERLRNVMTQRWKGKTEDIRNDVIQSALDTNIAYMSNKTNDNIRKFASDILTADSEAGTMVASESADTAIALALSSGFITQEQAEDHTSFIDRNEVLADAKFSKLTFTESKTAVEASNLPQDRKEEAFQILNANEQERIRLEKEALAATQELNLEDGFGGISTRQISTMPELDAMLADDGIFNALNSSQSEKLRAALRRQNSDRDKGAKPDDPAALRRLDDALMANTDRAPYLRILYDNAPFIQASTYIKFRDWADNPAFGRKNEQAVSLYTKAVEDMGKQGFWGKDPLDILSGQNEMMEAMRDLQFSDGLTAEEIATEQGFTVDTAKQLIANFQDQIVSNILKDQPIREDDGNIHWTDIEKLIKHGLEGRLVGRTNLAELGNFLTDPTMSTDTLQDNVAKTVFFKNSYDDLSGAEKDRVNVTVVVGQMSRKAEDIFKLDYPGVDAIMGIEIETNLPTARTADNLYRLELEGREEKWKVWNGQIGEYIEDESVQLPETSTTESFEAVKLWRKLQELLKRTPDIDIEPLQLRGDVRGERLRQLLEVDEQIIPQGNASRPTRGRTRGIGQ